MDPFVTQLTRLCTTHPTRAKWVFVPTHGVGRTLGERIAREGTNWLNLRFVTPLEIALRMGAPFLLERGIDPSEEGLGPALMMRLLLDLPAEGGYFRPLADHPTMAQALWTTVRELRMAGVQSQALKPDAFSSPAKHAELVALLSSYERFLEQHQRGDMAAVYQEALQHPDWCPIQPQDCWTELPDTNWNPLQCAAHRFNARRPFSSARIRTLRRVGPSPLAVAEDGARRTERRDERAGVLDDAGIGAGTISPGNDDRRVSRRRP